MGEREKSGRDRRGGRRDGLAEQRIGVGRGVGEAGGGAVGEREGVEGARAACGGGDDECEPTRYETGFIYIYVYIYTRDKTAPALTASSPARLVNVSPTKHSGGDIGERGRCVQPVEGGRRRRRRADDMRLVKAVVAAIWRSESGQIKVAERSNGAVK